MASLSDGTLTLSVRLKDAAGNVGAAATHTCVKDTVAPTISSWAMYWTVPQFEAQFNETVYGDSSATGPLTPYCITLVDATTGEVASVSYITVSGTTVTFKYSWTTTPSAGDTLIVAATNNAIFDAAGNAMPGGDICSNY